MLIKLDIIAIISAINCVNVYFYAKNNKSLMPITFKNWYKLPNNVLVQFYTATSMLGMKILNIRIVKNKCYLVFLLNQEIKTLDINYQFGILFAQRYMLPIFTDMETLNKDGIKVTKEMIQAALAFSY